MEALGIDVGGSGIKAAPVDTQTGELLAERFRIPTPQPATPAEMMAIIAQLVEYFKWSGQIGCGFPAVIRGGTVHTAANIDASWIGVPIEAELATLIGQSVKVLNDADAAGLAEMRWGCRRPLGGRTFRRCADPDLRHRYRQRALHRWKSGSKHRVRPYQNTRQGR